MTGFRTWRTNEVLDATRIGGASYTAADEKAVRTMLAGTSREEPISVGTIALSTGIEGRAVRQILQDIDGKDVLIGKRGSGVFVCEFADDGDSMQSALESSWRTTKARCQLRQEFIASRDMPRRQGMLFDEPVELDDDE